MLQMQDKLLTHMPHLRLNRTNQLRQIFHVKNKFFVFLWKIWRVLFILFKCRYVAIGLKYVQNAQADLLRGPATLEIKNQPSPLPRENQISREGVERSAK